MNATRTENTSGTTTNTTSSKTAGESPATGKPAPVMDASDFFCDVKCLTTQYLSYALDALMTDTA